MGVSGVLLNNLWCFLIEMSKQKGSQGGPELLRAMREHRPKVLHTNSDLRLVHVIAGLLFLLEAFVSHLMSQDFSMVRDVTVTYMDRAVTDLVWRTEIIGEVCLVQLTAVFFVIAGTHHLMVALPGVFTFYASGVNDERNVFRAVEYSVSATIMLVITLLLVGERGISPITLVILANVTMQLLGYIAEMLRSRSIHFIAWFPFLATWLPIFLQFYLSMNVAEGYPFPSDYINVLVFGMFGLFCSFGVVQTVHLLGGIRFIYIEYSYVLLSLLTKSFLGFLVVISAHQLEA